MHIYYIYIHLVWHWVGFVLFMIYCMSIHSMEFVVIWFCMYSIGLEF